MRKTLNVTSAGIDLNKITTEFHQVAYLNSNDIHGRSLLALGAVDELVIGGDSEIDAFQALEDFTQSHKDWVFGYLNYDLKNNLNPSLKSQNPELQSWPLLHFFRPEIVVEWIGGKCCIHYFDASTGADRLQRVIDLLSINSESVQNPEVRFEQLVSEKDYLQAVKGIQQEIQLGNIYELNYCIPFQAEVPELDEATLYRLMNEQTQAPFSVYFQDSERALMCGSPERYLQKKGDKLTAQPIKGTCRRGTGDSDEVLKNQLRNDPKERAENIMITDLVRNDLSRVASPQSVRVEELCGIYTFKTVHQMISTISAKLADDKTAVDALRATFPVGSMTGAPKISAMKLIDRFEVCKRGLYSGAFGYFEPNGDFDFNVVIRSFLYNRKSGKLTFEVGSAITNLSDPKSEYEECLLKAEGLLKATKASANVA